MAAWRIAPVSFQVPANVVVNGITTFDLDNVFAVGDVLGGPPTFERWDGQSWQIRALSVPTGPSTSIWPSASVQDIDGLGPDDLWAVGSYSYWWPGTPPPGASALEKHVMTWHCDGVSWSPKYGYNAGDFHDELFGVCAAGSNAIWAAGMSIRKGQTYPLLERWDPQYGRWMGVEPPHLDGDGYFRDVAAIADDDAWAVGFGNPPSGDAYPIAARWDGTEWRLMSPPAPGHGAILEAVILVASDDVWGIGTQGRQGSHQAYITHWDGTHWIEATVPTFEGGAVLWGGAASTPNDLVAVGGRWIGPSVHVLVLPWDGSAWNTVVLPDIPVPGAIYPPQGNQYLRCVAAAKGVFWAGGLLVNVASRDMLDANTAP